ncbi:MAG TPA: hypothetical protein VFC63_22670 [Blastocatellia bacterium]|nr:hypothetical protein [Blastocatellia bacterium]
MQYVFHILIACILICGSSTFAQQYTPQFTDYPSRVIQVRRSVKIQLHSTPYTACYRTMLRKTLREGQLFAGHYSLGHWGCGTCIRLGIVDLTNGRSYVTPFMASSAQGLIKVKADSRLVIIDDAESTDGTLYYLWTGKRLLPIFKGKVSPREPEPQFQNCAEMAH